MNDITTQIENRIKFYRIKIDNIKFEIETATKLNYSLQVRKLADEKDILIEVKNDFEYLLHQLNK